MNPLSGKLLARAAVDIARLRAAFGYAGAGIWHTWRHQPNFRIECGIGALALALAWWLEAGLAPILMMSALVLALEMVNSAIEAVVDLASPEWHPLAKVAKDAAAGATLVAAIFSVLVGLVVMGPPLLAKLQAAWRSLTLV
ncbi:MAG: diacylglycerol kinase [Chloracidobacterium sp. CP2_5A]|nr:MAG: diacylglycerol kinase [Chloracidobacterium sp. CP2_5A]